MSDALAKGQAFLAENKSQDGVVELPSGLQYRTEVAGEGRTPSASDTVEVHYHGTLIDGTVFDSSVERGQTISFPLSGVIAGWTEGLQQMQEGGKITLYIPPELAYGPSGAGGVIGPNETLIFTVDLVRIH